MKLQGTSGHLRYITQQDDNVFKVPRKVCRELSVTPFSMCLIDTFLRSTSHSISLGIVS